MLKVRFRRATKRWHRLYRETRMVARALRSPSHPVLAHVVVTRRCNLACTYCSEFDDFSKPVPTDEMLRRIDQLAALGTTNITLTGGETLLHPDIEKIIARIREHGILAFQVTNGYLLTIDKIKALNRAGLDHMQISVDNVQPDEVSKKSLKSLDGRLEMLSEWAVFQVNINSVLGSGVKNSEDALTIAHRALALGFTSTVGIIHDHDGQLKPLVQRDQEIFEEIMTLGKRSFSRFNEFQHNVARGREHDWKCRAGSRYLYICEDGLVHWCSQQRGYPGIPLEKYTRADLRRELVTEKSCAPHCTVSCVHQVSIFDAWRAPQRPATASEPANGLVQIE